MQNIFIYDFPSLQYLSNIYLNEDFEIVPLALITRHSWNNYAKDKSTKFYKAVLGDSDSRRVNRVRKFVTPKRQFFEYLSERSNCLRIANLGISTYHVGYNYVETSDGEPLFYIGIKREEIDKFNTWIFSKEAAGMRIKALDSLVLIISPLLLDKKHKIVNNLLHSKIIPDITTGEGISIVSKRCTEMYKTIDINPYTIDSQIKNALKEFLGKSTTSTCKSSEYSINTFTSVGTGVDTYKEELNKNPYHTCYMFNSFLNCFKSVESGFVDKFLDSSLPHLSTDDEGD